MSKQAPRVLLIATNDTKQAEAAFLRQCLEAEGVDVIHLDASIRRLVGRPRSRRCRRGFNHRRCARPAP